MRRSKRTSLMVLIGAVLALAAAGCGGGEVAADEVPGSPPALTVPSDNDIGGGSNNASGNSGSGSSNDSGDEETDGETGTAEPTATPTPEPDASGGATAPEATAAPDTAANDTPPEAGSPPEQFEDFCEQNAGAC
jgi:hypothetical protein